MGQRLYVGNLSYSTNEDSLRELFSQYGEVESVTVMSDRETGRSRGFGFVEMADASSAMEALNGAEFEGRTLRVDLARERPGRA